MNRVCIYKTTGSFDSQSGGRVDRLPPEEFKTKEEYDAYMSECDALESRRLDTLRVNALNAGYTEDQIEVKWVTDAELAALTAPTPAELGARQKQDAINAIQAILDAKAKDLGFDTIHTASVWTISKNPARKARADALVLWADSVWDFAEAEWEKQGKGESTFTTVDEFLAGAPKFPGVVG